MSDPHQGDAIHSDSSPLRSEPPPTNLGWHTDAATQPVPLDGRYARAQRTHQAVLDGLRECLEEGIPQPTAKQIAERAGVSLRGVFRHFEHLDSLLIELDKREHERVAAEVRPGPLGAPVEKRVESFLRACARIYEGTTVVRRALQRYAATSEALERYRERQRIHAHRKILTVFDQELAPLSTTRRRERVQEISALTSWSQWEELRRYEGLSVLRSRRILARKLAAALASTA